MKKPRGTTLRLALAALVTLLPGAASAQTETPLHTFSGGSDGAGPWGLLLHGNALYGTTGGGGVAFGNSGFGTVFKLTKKGTETVLWTFGGPPNDGAAPIGGLAIDQQGNLYGTTNSGGTAGEGTVFELTPSGGESVLYNFVGSRFLGPLGNVVLDKTRNLLYGTAYGAEDNPQSIYRLNLATHEASIFYPFGLNSDGNPVNPRDDLAIDGKGNLYGTTAFGGKNKLGSVSR